MVTSLIGSLALWRSLLRPRRAWKAGASGRLWRVRRGLVNRAIIPVADLPKAQPWPGQRSPPAYPTHRCASSRASRGHNAPAPRHRGSASEASPVRRRRGRRVSRSAVRNRPRTARKTTAATLTLLRAREHRIDDRRMAGRDDAARLVGDDRIDLPVTSARRPPAAAARSRRCRTAPCARHPSAAPRRRASARSRRQRAGERAILPVPEARRPRSAGGGGAIARRARSK